ncbi:cell envelope integrity protein TolA [Luteimonas sp. Y-2-2-4F]|nr:cell envelope integrity protein TolA [Luteimonas sp. Y-2-2-4F]MCD9032648.1 cell envelope integrity protein TolA [Luteimonas sp. Y-2-2-4F]
MRQQRAETVRAVLLALGLHVLLILMLVFGLDWTRSRAEPAFGSPVSADIIDPDALSAAQQRALAADPEPLPDPPAPPEPLPTPEPEPEPVEQETAPPPQPLPAPVPEDAPVEPQREAQERIPDPDTVDQDAARQDAESELTAQREQEERRRQEQIDLTERQRQEEAEQKRRLAQQQREEELRKLRAERERVRREADLSEQRLRQIAEARARQAADQAAASSQAASPPPGRPDGSSDLAAKYAAALQEAIARQWTRPDNVPLGQRCRIYITQLPGGEVLNVEFDPACPYDPLGRRSVEAAVRRAAPLPYAGFESVFNRRLNLNFTAQDR